MFELGSPPQRYTVDHGLSEDAVEGLTNAAGLLSRADMVRLALGFYDFSVQTEQLGKRIVAVKEDMVTGDRDILDLSYFKPGDLMFVHFENMAGKGAFVERYRRHPCAHSGSSFGLCFTDAAHGQLSKLSERMGNMPVQDIVKSALARYAVAIEITKGLGLFSTAPHLLAVELDAPGRYHRVALS